MRRIASLCAIGFAALGLATVRIDRVNVTDAAGNPASPKVGEKFFVSVDLSSNRTQGETTMLKFGALSGERQTPRFLLKGSGRVVWGPFQLLAHEPMAISVRADGAPISVAMSVFPAPLAAPVESYDPTDLTAEVRADYRGKAQSSIEWWLPTSVDDFEVQKGGLSALSTIEQTACAFRSDQAALRTAAWGGFETGDVRWLGPETYAESSNTEIVRWAQVSRRATPYDTAKAIYLATIKKLRYQTGRTADALLALRTGSADCGGFSSLFVAGCRSQGIPARTLAGARMGRNGWHVWAEFWLQGYGWVPCDPSAADSLAPNGDTAAYFGIMPEGNSRIVIEVGLDRERNGRRIPMLQSPAAFLADPRAGVIVPSVEVRPAG